MKDLESWTYDLSLIWQAVGNLHIQKSEKREFRGNCNGLNVCVPQIPVLES